MWHMVMVTPGLKDGRVIITAYYAWGTAQSHHTRRERPQRRETSQVAFFK